MLVGFAPSERRRIRRNSVAVARADEHQACRRQLGAGIGAGIGELKKRHEEKELGVDVEEYLPPDSSAVIVVADDIYADRIDKALTKSSKKISKAIDSGDYEKLEKELKAADKRVSDAVDS